MPPPETSSDSPFPAASRDEESGTIRFAGRRIRPAVIAALLLAAYFFMAVTAARTKSATFDEIVHITAGYNAWLNHDQRFDPGNGDFVKRWATLPLLATQPAFPPLASDAWRTGDFFPFSREFMFESRNDPDAILRQTRSMVALLGVALGALVFVCSRRLFGPVGALVSVTLFAFCPHLLAHGALVSTDLALSFALLASTWFIWQLLHVASWENLAASLLALGLLVTSKMSAVLIVPISGVLVLARLLNPEPWPWGLGRVALLASRARRFAAMAVLAIAHVLAGWLAVWTIFEFKYLARADPTEVNLTLLRTPGTDLSGPIGQLAAFCHQHRLLPQGYLKGMEELVGIGQRRPSFMHGEWTVGGRAAFFPYAFWVKTPPALLVLLLLGAAGGLALARRNNSATFQYASLPRRLYAAIPFLALFAVYAAVALAQKLNIGHRHILALYPVLYILAGSVALLLPGRGVALAMAALLGWHAADSLIVRPHYLAYFSPVAGGPAQGYRRLADSSLDWGQDLPGLKRWLDAQPAAQRDPFFFSYFGTGDPDHYAIQSWRLPGFPEWRERQVFALEPGTYAISATMFQQLYATTFGPWNRQYEADYQAILQRLGLTPPATENTRALATVLQAHPEAEWQELYSRYEKLRFARLCAWLRATHRAPDAQIGYSILVWRLDDRALHAVLWSAPLELREAPVR